MSATSLKSVEIEDGDIEQSVAALIEKIPPFEDLPQPVRAALAAAADRRRYNTGQTVFSTGQYDGAEFFVVIAGRLKVTVIEADTGAMLIEEFGVNSVFGLELAMSARGADVIQKMAVTAETDLELVAFETDAFRTLAAQRPSLMKNLAFCFADALATTRFKANATQSAPEQRVYSALLEHIERDAVTGAWLIAKMPKHRELAEQAGVDETVAAAAVASLIQEAIAHRQYPGLVIEDMARLNQLAT